MRPPRPSVTPERRSRPARRVALAALVVVLAATTAGCGLFGSDESTADPTSGTTGRPTTTVAPTTTTTAPPAATAPVLLSPGAEPRRVLAFALTPNQTSTTTITTDSSVTQQLSSGDRVVDPPPIRQTVRVRVGAADATGAALSFRVTKVEVVTAGTAISPATALLLAKDLQPVVGTTGSGRLLPDGRLADWTLRVPSGVAAPVRRQAADLTAQLGQLTPRLPRAAVGVGGSWSTDDTTTVGGIAVRQQVTYVVTALTDRVVTYRSTTTATGGRQPVELDTLPAGTTAELRSSTLQGTATGTIDLATPLGTLQATLAGDQVIAVGRSGDTATPVTQRLDLATAIRPAP